MEGHVADDLQRGEGNRLLIGILAVSYLVSVPYLTPNKHTLSCRLNKKSLLLAYEVSIKFLTVFKARGV